MYSLTSCAAGLMRHICKALEEVGILEKSASVKGGRKLTASGQRDMDLIAGAFLDLQYVRLS